MATENVIKTLTIRGSAEGVADVEKALRKVVDAQEDVTASAQKQEKATLSVEAAYKRLQTRYDQEFKAQTELARVRKTLDQALAQGLVTQQRAGDLMQQAIKYHNQNKDAVTLHASALKELESQAQAVATSFGPVGTILSRIGPVGLGVAATLGVLVIAMRAAAEAGLALAERASKLQDLSETIGLTTTQLQAFEIAAGRSGVTQEQLTISLEHFSSAFADVRNRTGGAYEALTRINPAMAQQISNAKTLAEALDLTAKAFESADESARNFAARQLFGRGGIGITRVLAETGGAGGLKAFTDQLNETDLLTQQQIENWKKFGDAINENLRLAKQNLLTVFGPPALEILDKFSASMLNLSRTLKEMEPGEAFKKFQDWLIDPRLISIVQALAGLFDKFRLIPSTTILGTPVPGAPAVTPAAPAAGAPGQGMFPAAEAEERARGIEMLKAAMKGVTEETDKSTKANEDWRTKAIQAANDSQRLMTALGGTATASEQLNNRLLQLNKQVAEGAISSKDAADAAARLKAEFDLNALRANVTALGSAATVTEKYALQVAELTAKLKDGTITQETFNRAVANANPILQAVDKAIGDLGSAMATAFINGADAAQAFNASLKSIASTAASETIRNLIKGDIVGAAISGSIALVAGITAKLTGGPSQEDVQKAQQLADAAKSASQALDGVVKSFNDLVAVAVGPVTGAIKGAQSQFQALQQAAQASQLAAAASFFAPEATATQRNIAFVQFQQAGDAVQKASDQLREFNERTIDTARAALRGSDTLSQTSQAIADLNKQADDLRQAMQDAGTSAEDAAAAVSEDLAVALQRLTDQITQDITRQAVTLLGKDYINQFNDLFQAIKDAQAAGVSADLLAMFQVLKAQDIVNNAQLTGQAFQDLITLFPILNGWIHEFNGALEDTAKAAQAAAERAIPLYTRLAQATQDANTLAGQLFLFDQQANLQRAEEAQAGGQNMVLLEEVLAYERYNIIKKFADEAIAEEKRAADERQKAIIQASKNIMDYLNQLLVGPQSALSPSARLQAAQNIYNTQLALAQAGDIEALQNITKYAEDLRKAAQDFYGSATGYQTVLGTIQSQLGALPTGASGGWVSGGGIHRAYGGSTDTVPAMLTPGEYVIRRSVALANAGALSQLNTTGRWPANDNMQAVFSRIEMLLTRIADLEARNADATDYNTAVTAQAANALTRESRFSARKAG